MSENQNNDGTPVNTLAEQTVSPVQDSHSGVCSGSASGASGWVAVSRSMRDHWLVGFGQPVTPMAPERGAFSRAEAWLDLIMECRYDAGTVNNAGHRMELLAGQLLGAVSWLASRWNWTPKTVRGFLDKLSCDGMIEFVGNSDRQKKGKQAKVLTVCNYSQYQIVAAPEGKQRANRGQTKGNIYKDNTLTKEQVRVPLLSPKGDATPADVVDADASAVPAPRTSSAAHRGTRLPETWVLTLPLGQWALQHYAASPEQIRTEAAKFKNYWLNRPGKGGTKIDWDRTWKNWVHDAASKQRWKPLRADTSAVGEMFAGLVAPTPIASEASGMRKIHDDLELLRQSAARCQNSFDDRDPAFDSTHPNRATLPKRETGA